MKTSPDRLRDTLNNCSMALAEAFKSFIVFFYFKIFEPWRTAPPRDTSSRRKVGALVHIYMFTGAWYIDLIPGVDICSVERI